MYESDIEFVIATNVKFEIPIVLFCRGVHCAPDTKRTVCQEVASAINRSPLSLQAQ